MPRMGATMTVLRPAPNLLAFYDGRISGVRAFSTEPNWLDDGAYALGVASYAIIDGDDALVYDTHISIPHALIVRQTLADLGVRRLRVVLSHWHLDHVAGTEVFADSDIIAHALTAAALTRHRVAIEAGSHEGAPAIRPLFMPSTTYEGSLRLEVGSIRVVLRHVDIHSCDGTVLMLPDRGLLLAGDTLEDTVTYVAEPDRLECHLTDLHRLAGWDIAHILPNHGAREIIAAGGYGTGLIGATERYLRHLIRCRDEPDLRPANLRSLVAEDVAAGTLSYFEPYEAVHRHNIASVATAAVPAP